MENNKWQMKVVEGAICSTGKPYTVSFRKGTSNNLLVMFQGGGMSWNEYTADRPLSVSALLGLAEGYYINRMMNATINMTHVGLLKINDERNPFHDWNILNVPYSTADFHLGDNEFHYTAGNGKEKILYHHGYKNMEKILEVLHEEFPESPEKLMIMGSSAGGFGVLYYAPLIAALYPWCANVTVYSEATHISTPLWKSITQDVWKIPADLQNYVESDNLIYDLFRYARDNMPEGTKFLHSNSVWDRDLTRFLNKLRGREMAVSPEGLQEFHRSLLPVEKQLKKDIPNLHYYLTDYNKNAKDGTTPHTFAGHPELLYTPMQDGISLADWLYQATEDVLQDVGEKFLTDEEEIS